MSTILPCRCGGDGRVIDTSKPDSVIDRELGQVRRTRRCNACGARWPTTELPTSELQALRLAAHTLLMDSVRLRKDLAGADAFSRAMPPLPHPPERHSS